MKPLTEKEIYAITILLWLAFFGLGIVAGSAITRLEFVEKCDAAQQVLEEIKSRNQPVQPIGLANVSWGGLDGKI